jgi:ADP-ribosyl-[dinitrogen reductase] hydrolase
MHRNKIHGEVVFHTRQAATEPFTGRHMTRIAQRSTEPRAIEDRAIGALLGLAIGDAIGTTLEFRARDTYEPLSDMVGGGPFGLKVGEWTDDTAMALALADSLEGRDDLDELELLSRFVDWWQLGTYSCTGECFDIGITTRHALVRWQSTRHPHCGSTDPMSAGNGSLMRLAPVAIRFWNDRVRLRDIAGRQSKTTHAAPEAVDACIAFAEVLADAIEGRSKLEVLRARSEPYVGAIGTIMSAQWRDKTRTAIRSTGYVAHSLEAALWCVDRSNGYRDAVLMAANLGEDADTTAAITGQLAGALYGASDIPNNWAACVAWGDQIKIKAANLVGKAAAEDRSHASSP